MAVELIAAAAAQIIWYPNPSPQLQRAWPPLPSPILLTSATIVMKIINPAGVESTVTMSTGVDSLGIPVALYNIRAADVPTPGVYTFQMWVTPSGGGDPFKTRQRAVEVGVTS